MHNENARHYEKATPAVVAPLLREFAKQFTNETRNLLEDAAALLEAPYAVRGMLKVAAVDAFDRFMLDPGTENNPGSYYLCNRENTPVAIVNVFQFSDGRISMDVIPGTGMREKAAAIPTKLDQAIIFRANNAGRIDMDVPADAAIVNITIAATESTVKYTDIGAVPDKKASTLVNMDGTSNAYNEAIRVTAEHMVAFGRGDWIYRTQYSSGTTLWCNTAVPDNGQTCMVSTDGSIRN
jgi:hypothetical protein